jgi:hypothetical protein
MTSRARESTEHEEELGVRSGQSWGEGSRVPVERQTGRYAA